MNELHIILIGVLSLAFLICFFLLCSNVASIKKLLEKQNEKFISLLTLKPKAMQSTHKTNKLSEKERLLTLERLRNAVNSTFE